MPHRLTHGGRSNAFVCETEVTEDWSKIVGDLIAAHSVPVSITRRNPPRPRASTHIALRVGTSLQARNFAQTKTTLRPQNHPRRPLPRRVTFPQLELLHY